MEKTGQPIKAHVGPTVVGINISPETPRLQTYPAPSDLLSPVCRHPAPVCHRAFAAAAEPLSRSDFTAQFDSLPHTRQNYRQLAVRH
jgi:hypothetical protein